MLHVTRRQLLPIHTHHTAAIVSNTTSNYQFIHLAPTHLRCRPVVFTKIIHSHVGDHAKRNIHARPIQERLSDAKLPDVVTQTPEEFYEQLTQKTQTSSQQVVSNIQQHHENAVETLLHHHSNTPIVIPADVADDDRPHKELPSPHTVRVEKLLPRSHLNFNQVKKAFQHKSSYELARSLFVFKLCSWTWLVKHARTLLDISYSVFGNTITNTLMRHTFFAHFCAGESGDTIGPVINKLQNAGVGAILDYAAESDVSAEQAKSREGIVSARVYDYSGEEECDANAQICLACIADAGRRPDGFAAIKLTALGKPELLQHLTNVLNETKVLFTAFLTQQPIDQIRKQINSIDIKQQVTYDQFQKGLTSIGINLNDKIAKKIFNHIDSDHSGSLDYVEWISYLDPRSLGGLNPQRKIDNNYIHKLDDESMKQLNNMISRLELLAEAANKHGVRLMIDAEQTYFQPAIDHLVLGLQRKYNRTMPLIYNTYQCYLKDTRSRLMIDIERAKREGFLFAAKVVRGAYMIQERKRADDHGYESPIHNTIQDTHTNYDLCVDYILQHIDMSDIMVATHNEQSVKYTEQRMRDLSIPAKGGGVFFGQLLGMCDHVSFSLGVMGFSVFKYVPYGQINEVIPYLLRRAEENSNMLGSATKERQLIARELLRRLGLNFITPLLKPLPVEDSNNPHTTYQLTHSDVVQSQQQTQQRFIAG